MSHPLEGIKVLDLTRALAGPFCSMILGDLGAKVIKVEPTPKGEMSRAWAPFDRGIGVYFMSINRNKESLVVDFRTPEALRLLQDLAAKADVVVENFKPGSTAEMGLDYESLRAANPKLIYASITGFGADGPYGTWPGYDQIGQGMSGMMSISGFPDGEPTRLGVPLADLCAGMWSALGVTAAVAQRHVTGEGQRVDTSLLAGLVGMLCVQGQRYLSLGQVPGRIGNDHPVLYPFGAFEAADGLINCAAATEGQWAKLCEVLDVPELVEKPEYADSGTRSENRAALKDELDARFRSRPVAEWTKVLMEAGIPAGPIYTLDQVFADPQVQHCNMAEEIEHPVLGAIRLLSNPLRMTSFEGRTVRTPPPQLGEHSRSVLQSFGYSDQQIGDLIGSGVVAEMAETQEEAAE
ncbi:MAG: CaiB/BaiF CoA transferase family protein [Methyloligellaceae bacterium]